MSARKVCALGAPREGKVMKETASIQVINKGELVGRNHRCSCGSGQKFKSCHYRSRRPRPVNLIVHRKGAAEHV